ncbi:protein kinase [Caldilinea sp.]|uniref:protein kinase domain-containing protein n=1 Tax=Caldilinea sp. TaxID=2293560 RepID=UPI002CC25BAC|nr:protein kinase [Caldilinea sp.]
MSPAELSSFESDRKPTSALPRSEAARGLLVGYQVGRYRLVEKLGGGVMAAVYHAVDEATGQPAAVKVLLADADAVVRERFRQEARTHRQLYHSNIVPILDEGHEAYSDITYLVMTLVEGSGLNGLLEAQERLSVHDAAALLTPVARALSYAHQRGIIHRDVKPSNVLLQRAVAGQPGAVEVEALGGVVLPLLSDFGIARALDSPELTGVGRTIGTPIYMSPEQCADSHDLDGRSDLYSLGALFYRCLVGRPPFTGSTTQILHAHVYEPLMIPDAVVAALPEAAVEILRRALAKEPAARYATGDEMALAFERLLASTPTNVPPTVESTATMPALAVVRPPTTMQVLVPGPQPAPRTPPSVPSISAPSITPEVVTPRNALPPGAPILPAATPIRSRRWIGALLGAALSALLLVGGVWAALNLLPLDLFGVRTPAAPVGELEGVARDPEATANTSAQTPAPGATPFVAASPTQPANDAALATDRPGDLGTPFAPPTPAGPIEGYWREAEDAYAAHEWQVALDYYTLVQRIDVNYQLETMAERLFDVQTGLAAEALIDGQNERAVKALDAALALRPDAAPVVRVRNALDDLMTTDAADAGTARGSLWEALVAYAEQLAQAEAYCGAAAQLTAAVGILPDGADELQLNQFRTACDQSRALADISRALADNGGRILYSTQDGDQYNIYSAVAQVDSDSTLLIADGVQVGVQRNGAQVAFLSTLVTEPGIVLFDLTARLDPTDRTRRLTAAPEDAHDAPPAWASDGSALAYSTLRVDKNQSRIFVHTLANNVETDLGLGKDPAWEPAGSRIIYNGVDASGERPGLYIMSADGDNRLRLTDNGNDIRPVWSPNGNSVVFMSTRNGNWDVYRLSLRDDTFIQLTDDPAQDGLPAISPDGKLVVFASDRSGKWQLYVVPIDGGEAVALFAVNGVLTDWLEHSIQWTR